MQYQDRQRCPGAKEEYVNREMVSQAQFRFRQSRLRRQTFANCRTSEPATPDEISLIVEAASQNSEQQ